MQILCKFLAYKFYFFHFSTLLVNPGSWILVYSKAGAVQWLGMVWYSLVWSVTADMTAVSPMWPSPPRSWPKADRQPVQCASQYTNQSSNWPLIKFWCQPIKHVKYPWMEACAPHKVFISPHNAVTLVSWDTKKWSEQWWLLCTTLFHSSYTSIRSLREATPPLGSVWIHCGGNKTGS